MTYNELINKYKKYIDDTIELEGIEYIIQETNNLTRSKLILIKNEEVINLEKIEKLLKAYCINHLPCQYLIGYTYFYGLKLKVNSKVLIPRFDTEILVEEVINYLNTKTEKIGKKQKFRIVDIGTGSGAIAIAIKKNSDCLMEAVDISSEALEIAKTNAIENDVYIEFKQSDILSNCLNNYDIIVSNPPYIDKDDPNEGVQKMVNDSEPHLALYSSDNGLNHYKRIIEESKTKLKNDGMIFLEIPDNKCDKIINYANKYYNFIRVVKDYQQLRRVLIIGEKKNEDIVND